MAHLRRLIHEMRAEASGHLQATTGVLVSGPDASGRSCTQCAGRMRVQKTLRRHAATLQHGHFQLKERVLVCRSGCRDVSGHPITTRPARLGDILLPKSVFGYDVMVFAGLRRFVDFRQREEIVEALEEQGVTLSTGEVSYLCRRFLEYLEALHWARAPEFKAALAGDGGWILHLDATCEEGQGTLLVIMSGWRPWVLSASKIPTERAEAILPRLEEVGGSFGMPIAAMRDLGRAVTSALEDFTKGGETTVTVLGCHSHFLADVGRDLQGKHHDRLRKGLKRHKLLGRLRSMARELGRKLGTDVGEARKELSAWQEEGRAEHRIPPGRAGLAVVRGLVQWVLDYKADGEQGRPGFPYERPYLYLYDRCCDCLRAVDAYRRVPPDDRQVCASLEGLRIVLRAAAANEELPQAARHLRERVRLFKRLRSALRLHKKSRKKACAPEETIPDPLQLRMEIRDVRASLARLIRQLRKERPERGPAGEQREGIDIIVSHYRRHRKSLWGHEVKLPEELGGGVRIAPRTNNLQEQRFHKLKHGERRRSGRKRLSYDLEKLPAAAILASNLEFADYVNILCGTLDSLPRAFAAFDRAREAKQAEAAGAPGRATPTLTKGEVETTSLPAADRRLVRAEGMRDRIYAAAASRAPRSAGKTI